EPGKQVTVRTLSISQSGFEFVGAVAMRAALESVGSLSDWPAFAASWTALPVDPYLAEERRFRRRRFAVFSADNRGTVERQPHQPHLQAREYKRLFCRLAGVCCAL